MLEPVEISRSEGGNPPTVRPRPAAPPTGHEEVGPAPLKQDQLQLTPTRLSFSKGENGEIIVRVFDQITGELIRQIPPPDRLRLATKIRSIVARLQE